MTPPVVIGAMPTTDDGLVEHYGQPPDGIRMNMVMGLDGAIAIDGRTGGLTGPVDQMLLRHLRSWADVVVVGAGTIRAERYGPLRMDPAQQTRRRDAGYAELDPPLAVVTATGSLPRDLPFLAGTSPLPLVITTTRALETTERNLGEVSQVVAAGDDRVEPAALLEVLRRRGLRRILCEGGPSLFADLIAADAVAEMCLSLSPVLVGDRAAARPSVLPPAAPLPMRLCHVLHTDGDDTLFLSYRR